MILYCKTLIIHLLILKTRMVVRIYDNKLEKKTPTEKANISIWLSKCITLSLQ